MGIWNLFRSNSDKVEKVSWSKNFNIICPYCFKEYSTNAVVFRATHSIAEDPAFSLKEDKLLNAYREKLNLDSIPELEAVILPEQLPSKNKTFVDGVLMEVTDNYGFQTKKRLCPHCHNELPLTSGRGPTKIISVVGASQVGKTVFMTSMIHSIQNSSASHFNAACTPVSSKYSEDIKKNYDLIFNEGQLLNATQKEIHVEPLILQLKYKDSSKPSPTLVFYDVAGEGMTDQNYLQIHAPHIKNSAGILFLVDPLQMRTLRTKLYLQNAEEKGDFTEVYAEPKEILIHLFENFIAMSEKETTKIPTAIVITKSDMLKEFKDEKYIHENSNIFSNYSHKEYFNLCQYENIDGEVRSFMSKVDLPFKDAVEAYFSNNGFFAVSSLGCNPNNQRIQEIVSPIRVDEPFLWLLYKMGIIEGSRKID